MEVTFIQRVLQIRLHCGPCTEVFITQKEVKNIVAKLSYKHLFNCAILAMEKFGQFLRKKLLMTLPSYNQFLKPKCF